MNSVFYIVYNSSLSAYKYKELSVEFTLLLVCVCVFFFFFLFGFFLLTRGKSFVDLMCSREYDKLIGAESLSDRNGR